jgi:acetyl esterase/lipase
MIRLVLIIIFFLISLLAVFKAPAYYLWLLAIAVTEFPLIFAGIVSLLTLSGFWVQKYQLAGTVIGVVALILFLSPIARAYIVSRSIVANFESSFGTGTAYQRDKQEIFRLSKLFTLYDQTPYNTILPYKTITYVKYADTSLTMDYYAAKEYHSALQPPHDEPEIYNNNRPCVIVVHGGSWAGGDSKQLPELNSYLAARGFNVAVINYRLAPKYQTPAPVEDIKAAMAYIRQHAADLHADTTKFVLLGRSAGAQIALLAAYTMHEPTLKGVIDFYGPADMVWGYSIPSNPLIMDSRKVMGDYIGGTYKQVPQKYFNCSPIEFVSRQSVPTLLIHGENDVLVSPIHSQKLTAKLQQNGIKHYYLNLPWATHGFDFNLNGPGGQLSTFAVETFLNTVTQ